MASESVELQLFPDRMVCAILDRARARFYQVTYDRDFFDEYVVDDVESIVVFVEDIHNLLKSTNKKDVLILEVNDPYLVAKVVSDSGNSRIFEFVLSTDFVTSPTPPTIDLSAVIECDVGDLKQSVKDIELIGSSLYTFVCDGSILTVMTDQDIATKYANSITVAYQKEPEETVSSSFSVEYIKQLLKFDKISMFVRLEIGDEMPVLFSFSDELMGVEVTGMIAPRLSEE